ncbi:CDP-glucose 4,6-dehydratase [Cyanobium sp. ATX 6F1]|uniref:CDP-glucose 4,6-dehydratase n=1 Tax=unclassified Cyanobium TaxID=2627006 RepID=UPI0020CD4037|nr:CDP-glucose 4,6-dehydratase [Cyanobium sp. ATX 6F1]MCP9916651.1 CDP-glucose 4,6-dehydratase [Cyanobium sp. ATX 6F1]
MNPDSSFWPGKRVLLTGHTGFKGSWLLMWLVELGAEVWGYALEAEPAPNLFRALQPALNGRFLHLESDLTDREVLSQWVQEAQPEIVLHLAAQPLVRRSYLDPLGTWATNVMGSLHLLEALKPLSHPCAVVMVTTDKVYQNQEWLYGYRENDPLGGHDPYSASKAGAEIAIASWRASFCGTAPHQSNHLRIATARAGNVIGGGDWAADRIVPDAMRALAAGEPIAVRNPGATRPWQHVLEPLGGYLQLAERLATSSEPPVEAFNFGPTLASNRPVRELVESILEHWNGRWVDQGDPAAVHEANLLHLQIDKAHHQLGWRPRWDFAQTIERTVGWYRSVHAGSDPTGCCRADIEAYARSA